jgi:hypothetical protein
MHLPMHAVLQALLMHLPTHACLHARKPCCIVVGGPVSLAAVVKARNCGGRLGSCPGLVVGPSRDNAIAAAQAIGLASLPLSHPHCRPHHNWGFVSYPAACHGNLAFGGPVGVALVYLLALHWCPTHNALVSLPALYCH